MLPAGAIMEVVRYSEPRPLAGAADWVSGWIDWRGRALPVVVLDPTLLHTGPAAARGRRYLICAGPSGGLGADLFALLVGEHPRLVTVDAAALKPHPPGAAAARLPFTLLTFHFNGEATAVPDLEALEQALGDGPVA